MKVSELIQAIQRYPDAEVHLSFESFRRENIETLSLNGDEITLCAYNLLALIAETAQARIEDE